MSGIPIIVLDWDYDNFGLTDEGHYLLWMEPVTADGPPEVYVEGWPWCGRRLDRTLARRVGPFEYAPFPATSP